MSFCKERKSSLSLTNRNIANDLGQVLLLLLEGNLPLVQGVVHLVHKVVLMVELGNRWAPRLGATLYVDDLSLAVAGATACAIA